MGGECEREREQEWESGRECVRAERSLTVMRERASTSTATPAALPKPRTLQHQKKIYTKKKHNKQWAILLSMAFSTSPPFLFLFSNKPKLLFMQSKFWSHKSEREKERESARKRKRKREILCLTIIA